MTTVPLPRMVNARSTQSRTGASGSGAGSRATSRSSAARSSGRPAPVTRADRDRLDRAAARWRRARRGASPVAGAGSARSARVTTSRPCRTPSASSAARCSADCGIQPSSAATTNSAAGTGPTPASMFGHEPLVPGHVDEGDRRAGGQRGPGEAEVDGHAPAALLGPPVGFHPGQRADQGRLAVVDVPGGGDDVHVSSVTPGGAGGTAPRASVVVALRRARSAGRAAAGRARPARRTGGSPVRSGCGVPLGQGQRPRRQLDARARRRRRPPRAVGTTSAATPSAASASRSRSARSPQRVRVGAQRLPGRGRRPAQGRLQRGQGQLVDPQRPGQRVPAQPLDQVGAAEQQPGLRAAEQLVAAGGHQGRAGPQRASPRPARRAAAGRGASRPEPMSATTGTPERGQLARPATAAVKPRDHEVRRVHLEHEAGLPGRRRRRSRPAWCGWWCPPRAAARRWTASRSGSRKPSPISTSSPRLTTISRPAASAVAASTQRGGAVVDHVHGAGVRHGRGQRGERAAARGGPAARWPGRAPRRCARRRPPAPSTAAGDSGARPRLVCSTTPVALSTGRSAGRGVGQRGQRRRRRPRRARSRPGGPAPARRRRPP